MLNETDLENLVRKSVTTILQEEIFDETFISEIIHNGLLNLEYEVIQEKDSYKNYGDGSEYKGYDSWIDYWQKKSPNRGLLNTIKCCPCCGNPMNNPVGGHVQDAYGTKYITPICNSCNSSAANNENYRKETFRVKYKYLVEFDYDELRPLRRSK